MPDYRDEAIHKFSILLQSVRIAGELKKPGVGSHLRALDEFVEAVQLVIPELHPVMHEMALRYWRNYDLVLD